MQRETGEAQPQRPEQKAHGRADKHGNDPWTIGMQWSRRVLYGLGILGIRDPLSPDTAAQLSCAEPIIWGEMVIPAYQNSKANRRVKATTILFPRIFARLPSSIPST